MGSRRANLDLIKIEKISRNVQKMISAKQTFGCCLTIVNACKAAFFSAKRVTLFVIDYCLQKSIDIQNQSRYCRELPCDGT